MASRSNEATAQPLPLRNQSQQTDNKSSNIPARTESITSETDSTDDASNQLLHRQGRGGVAETQHVEDHGQKSQQLAPQNQQVQSKGKDAPSVRLDMDLDVEVDLKAKIQGDLELSILGGKQGKT